LRVLDCGIAELGRLAVGETLLRLRQGLLRLAQTTKDGPSIPLGHVMHEMEQIGYAQARQTGFSQFDQCLGPIAYQVPYPGPQHRQACCDHRVPGVIAAVRCDLFD
jgi:hypothetical protein